jgi:hypothetical protein
MKPKAKLLIAGAVTAMAAAFSTGASAQSLLELHEQHKAQLLNFVFGATHGNVSASVSVGPAYQPAPVYTAPAPAYPAYGYGGYGPRGPRWDEHRHHGDPRGYGHHDGRGDWRR